MTVDISSSPRPERVFEVLRNFTGWLDRFGEDSWDHQSFFAGPIGGRAKSLYYKHSKLGIAAVAPMIFCEAFLPAARPLFHHRIRFPIADAHYAMGFAFLARSAGRTADRGRLTADFGQRAEGGELRADTTEHPFSAEGSAGEDSGAQEYLSRAVHFLEALKQSRSSQFNEYCWGYPFDWVTRAGTIPAQTPFITSTPYMFEAFLAVHSLAPQDEWRRILESIVRHGLNDIKDFKVSEKASTCTYSPAGGQGVVNSAAYRAFMLTAASRFLNDDHCWQVAERNLYFVLESQNPDGSWYYAKDGVRHFVDHFHTCFVMKALAKIHTITGHPECFEALRRGVKYYLENLFDSDGLPKPFSKAPRMTVYKRELYDCAESINLCTLLRDRFPEMGDKLNDVIDGILADWIQPAGCFRARRLILGWDNVPMHRWGQAQMFRALAQYLVAERQEARGKSDSCG